MKRLIILFTCIIPAFLVAQDKGIPVNLSMVNQSAAIPFTRFFTTPIHPGVQAGTEFNQKFKKHSRLYQAANIFYFYHNHVTQAISLNTEIGYEYRLKNGLAFSALAGLGYMHSFSTADEFTFSDGSYRKKRDKGNSRIYPSVSLDLGYYPGKEINSTKFFLRYQAWAEFPYSPGFISVMTHINLHVGVKFFICKNAGKNE